ncbi:ABC transporter permease subunit [uncultured Jatrophihabitans sp.]|uniref:ABC transporter permease subunit n=1 Tax=uncultured Jatrophihabitans sp. TaxID=1610747 RepID=UPI0035CC71C3
MTATTTHLGTRAPAHTAALRWKRARGLAWVTWRQQRTAYVTTAAVLGGLAVLLLVNGLAMHSNYRDVGLSSCGALDENRCQVPLGLFEANYQSWAQYIPRFVIFVPGLLAAFVAAPLIAREVESGTYRFAWTQSRSRSSWLAAKVVLVLVPIALAAVGFSALFAWWFAPFTPLMGRMSIGQAYEVSGTVFAARTAFGLALGLLFGAVLRRVVAAMAVTLALWVATVWVSMVYLRPVIEHPLDLPAHSSLITRGGWTVSEYFRGPSGAHLANKGAAFAHLYAQAQHDGVNDSTTFIAWLTRHGYLQYVTYQPEQRFWHFQLIESGGYLTVTLVIIATLFWWIRKHID